MMYSEFAEAVGCKDNEHNHEVFRNLEIMYMNSDMTKEEIYAYGRKLVDNSKTEEELRLEAEIEEEIEGCKKMISLYKGEVEWKQTCIEEWKDDKEYCKQLRREKRYYEEQIKFQRSKIKELKWVLGR